MRKSRCSEGQILGLPQEQEAGAALAPLGRRRGISAQTFSRWRQKDGGLARGGARRRKALAGGERPPQAAGGRAGAGQPGPEGAAPKKLVRPARRRAAARWPRERFGFSERRACHLIGLPRSTARYRGRARADEPRLRRRLREPAAERPRVGSRRLRALPRREGVTAKHKRLERLYRDERLGVRRRRRQRITQAGRGRPAAPSRPNERWAIACVRAARARGRRIRLPAALDVGTREALAIEVDASLPGCRVARVRARLVAEHGAPTGIVLDNLDNGPELAGRALDRWADDHRSRLRFVAPGKPIQNAAIEGFHGRPRDECPNRHWVLGLAAARRTVDAWRLDDNQAPPHSALGYRTPAEARRDFDLDRFDRPATRTPELAGRSG